LFVLTGAAVDVYQFLVRLGLESYGLTLAYAALFFAGHSVVNFPIELWIGYLEERQYGLAKGGLRAWSRDWLRGIAQHGVMFVIGSCLIITCQALLPHHWLIATGGGLLVLFLLTNYLAASLVPRQLIHVSPADASTLQRLEGLTRGLPPVVIFGAPTQRDFAAAIIGLANRQRLMISQSTIDRASATLLRYLLMHELGHRRMHYNLVATLVGWLWMFGGIAASERVIPDAVIRTPVSIAWLAMLLTTWTALTEPTAAFIGRQLERLADRYYLRHGGTPEEMRAALTELSRRNLERAGALPRRSLPRHVFRLAMWTPNLICRSLRSNIGKPHAWYVPQR
jgi:Zn-dependent protease with chaperone function